MSEIKNKPVYCLFVGNKKIETELLHYFIQKHYQNNILIDANILPITLKQLEDIFNSLFLKNKKLDPVLFRKIIDECLKNKDQLDAIKWGLQIEKTINNFTKIVLN